MIEVKNDIFYLLRVREEKFVLQEKGEAIQQLRERVKNISEVKPEELAIYEVNTAKEGRWEITQVSWAEIAIELMKESKK